MEKINFLNLATSVYFACWQQLGKVANPMTGKIERNLEHAKYSIDTLIMLREKTKGNLDKEEEKTLEEMIANLQLNYVDECNKPSDAVSANDKKDSPAK
jgi:polyhydroxyalkanoate synthesis regulator phasin